jgi:hypothetical protein
VVGPLLTRPIATLGRAGSWRDLPVDPGKFLEAVRHGLEREQAIPENR